MKTVWAAAYGVLGSLLVAGILYWVSRPPRGEKIILSPPPSPALLQIHVTGAVNQPGVYALPPGSRVQDAVAAAGGLSAEANGGALNLAAILEDGQRVIVPAQSMEPGSQPVQGAFPPAYPLNINTATQAELDSLPGIGPVMAQRILDYRAQHGSFDKVEDLEKVPGIGPATLEKIRVLVTVQPGP